MDKQREQRKDIDGLKGIAILGVFSRSCKTVDRSGSRNYTIIVTDR